jgi:hypothetical protein
MIGVLHRGNIRVLDGQIVAVSWDPPADFSNFGLEVTDEKGVVNLYLSGGGIISFETENADIEADEWSKLSGLI